MKRALTKSRKVDHTTSCNQRITKSSEEEIQELLDDSWISATSTYNYMMKDPLLDWLKYHNGSLAHKHRTYRNIVNKSIEDSKSTYNFTSYIMEQGVKFENKVMKLITKKFESERIAEIHGELAPRDPRKVEETLNAMKRGVPIIHSGVLHNPENKTFGIPDLLVRSDWLKFLVTQSPLDPSLETKSAPKLGKKWHYRVIDIKFTGLMLRADATHLLNAGSFPAYKSQLLIYNWALGHLQGYTPDQVYILGRRWKYTSQGETHVNNTCFDKFAIIDYSSYDNEYREQTIKALTWLREVKSDKAADWNITKYPLDRWELYPNMCNSHDYPWHAVKQQIAEESKELTNLWMVGPKNRKLALDAGVSQWTDKNCTPDVLGINGDKTSKVLSAIININQSKRKIILPKVIRNNIGLWKCPDKIEFFVDFETCNGAVSGIKRLPHARIETIVFMIGVGYIDPNTNKWISKDFTVDRLTFDEEARICREFSDFIRRKAKQHGVKTPRCIHWARAEDIMWADAVERHDPVSEEWKSWMWNWLDLLAVFKEEPIVINGCMSFGLKDVSAAMKKHGFINTSWDKNSACVDGQSAMVAARKANYSARASGISMKQVPVMKQIIEYNKVDVRVLYEIITYLRTNHITKTVPSLPNQHPSTSSYSSSDSYTYSSDDSYTCSSDDLYTCSNDSSYTDSSDDSGSELIRPIKRSRKNSYQRNIVSNGSKGRECTHNITKKKRNRSNSQDIRPKKRVRNNDERTRRELDEHYMDNIENAEGTKRTQCVNVKTLNNGSNRKTQRLKSNDADVLVAMSDISQQVAPAGHIQK